jgi:hypothetical protein
MMPPPKTRRFRSILCPIDASPQSAKALRYAEALSRTCGGRVTAVAGVTDPAVIVAHARAVKADVIVLGSGVGCGRSHEVVESPLLSVLAKFRGAVLVVPRRAPMPPSGWPSRNIAAVVGDDMQRRRQIAGAARMAERFGAWLSLVPSRPVTNARSRPELFLYPLTGAGRARMREADGVEAFVCAAAMPVMVIRVAGPRGARFRGITRAA